MSRKIDEQQHARRKEKIGEAVWRLVSRSGLESVSIRAVAGEAGVSIGQVQYYFESKDSLLMYGLEQAQGRMESRIEETLDRLTGGAGAAEVLRAAVREVVGGHPDTQQAIRISVAYLPRARSDARVREVLFGEDAELFDLAEEAIRDSQAKGRGIGGLDPEREARIIWALANSLGSEVAFGQTASEDALATVDYYLDRLLGR